MESVTTLPKCRFCGEVATVHVSGHGCACYPDDKDQWLCEQHFYKSEPLEGWEVIEDRLA